jgi:hypothetical protein
MRNFTLRSARFEHFTHRPPLLVMYIVIITGNLLRQVCLLMQRHGWSDRSIVAFECHFLEMKVAATNYCMIFKPCEYCDEGINYENCEESVSARY